MEQDQKGFEVPYFKELLHGVPAHLTELDEQLKPCLDRAIESVDPVERAILRLGTFEFVHHPEVPYRVVINEAVELAKVFGAEQGHKYVNGVLDKLAKKVRPVETGKK
jgi:N utilization substance protein B